MEWSYFEQEFGKQTTSEGGRPALPTRLMVGLHYRWSAERLKR
jgi:IS5 family transposase